MNGNEIRKLIDENNKKIEQILKPNQFTLNNIVSDLIMQNRNLQKCCEHNFDDKGFCIYCDKYKEA